MPARCDSVASSASFCARDAHKCFMPLCIGAFHIICLPNESLLIAFLVCLICHMVLPHYCAVRLKEMYLNFTAYSGANKYLMHCRFFKFSHLQRMERSVIFIVGTPQL